MTEFHAGDMILIVNLLLLFNFMKINIQYLPEADMESLYFAILLLRIGFFKERGFLLTTQLRNKIDLDNISVLIPKEIIQLGKEFIREIGGKNPEKYYSDCLKYNDSFTYDPKVVELININAPEIILQTESFSKKELKKIEEAIESLFKFFPLEKHIERIEINMKTSGTICSYRMIRDKVCRVEPRFDATTADIIFCVICSFIHEFYDSFLELDTGQITWEEKQRMAEFVVTKSNLTKITGEYRSINQLLDSNVPFNNPAAVEESNLLFESIGYPVISKVEYINGNLIANGFNVENFTDQEEHLLVALLNKSGSVLSYDEIAESIWKEESYTRFSIQAIQKTIERIRKKLDYYGVSSNMIVNRTGKGYMFCN